MKILKRGRKQKGWSTKATCTGLGNGNGGCGAELLVERDDLFRTESHARDETTTYTTFKCKACGVLTDLEDVPYEVQGGLPSKKSWEALHADWREAELNR